MITSHPTTSRSQLVRLARIATMILISLTFTTRAMSAPGNGNGTQKPPAVPTLAVPQSVMQGATNVVFNVDGDTKGNASYQSGLTASFSGSGITVNSVTYNSASSITLDISVALTAGFGSRTLTVTNPDGLSATSTVTIVQVIDLPVINAAAISPSPTVDTTQDITVSVSNVTNLDGSAVTFSYQWLENGALISNTTNFLPASATSAGATYTCLITPFKGSYAGPVFESNTITCVIDGDGNNIDDNWEVEHFNSIGNDPNGDADGDGLTNKAEFLFGLTPTDSKSCCVIQSALDPTTGEFSYSRPANDIPGAVYTIWVSEDLVNWTVRSAAVSSINNNGKSKTMVAELNDFQNIRKANLFVRVSVNYTPN